MLTIRDTNTTPREKRWEYPSVDGGLLTANSYMNLRREILMHYQANGKPVPTDEEVTLYLCENLTVPCYDGPTAFRNRFTDPPTFAQRGKPSPDWGVMLNVMKLMKKEEDRGLGDIIARVIGPIGGDVFKAWYKKIFGKSCGCSERQDEWNATYPL